MQLAISLKFKQQAYINHSTVRQIAFTEISCGKSKSNSRKAMKLFTMKICAIHNVYNFAN